MIYNAILVKITRVVVYNALRIEKTPLFALVFKDIMNQANKFAFNVHFLVIHVHLIIQIAHLVNKIEF